MSAKQALLAIVLCTLLITRAAGCSESDALATLDVVVCEHDALCADGVCTVDDAEVETVRVLARAVESTEGSRFGDAGLFVLATWERDGRWLELEFDVPTDRVGYVDMDIRYEEFDDGAITFRADQVRGRIVLVVPRRGDGLPYAAHLELRAVSDDGEVRRLHRGRLDPDDDGDIVDPGPPHDEVDWEAEGVELMIVDSVTSTTYTPPATTEVEYDWREGVDPFVDAAISSCASVAAESDCSGDDGGGGSYDDDYGGGSDYFDEESSGCGGEDASCEGDTGSTGADDPYVDIGTDSGCSGDSADSLCQGDSSDDVWDDDSSKGCACEAYDPGATETTSSCDSGDTGDSGVKSDCGGCEGDYAARTAARRHQLALRDRARGRAPRPVRQAFAFLPVGVAFAFTRLLRTAPRR